MIRDGMATLDEDRAHAALTPDVGPPTPEREWRAGGDWRQFARAGVFRLVQAALLPAGAVGYVLFVRTAVAHSRRTGSSMTVLASLYTRYMQHDLGTRRDEAGARLMALMPNVSVAGLRLLTAPTRLAHRASRHVPRRYRYPYPGDPPLEHQTSARTTFYDAALERYLPGKRQLVILGAGFDTRSYRSTLSSIVRCFELDQPKTQALKRELLDKAGIDTGTVSFVPVDFQQDDWLEPLVQVGFDPSQPSLFIWESVSMYLDREAVERTLRRVAGVAPGSVLAFDYFAAQFIDANSLVLRYVRKLLNATGEPWRFGIDNTPPVRQRVADFVQACGLKLDTQRNFGPEAPPRRAPAGFATAVVPGPAR